MIASCDTVLIRFVHGMGYIIAGLGNPTEEYASTRHNVGRMLVDALARTIGAPPWKYHAAIVAQRTKGELNGVRVELVLPDTYMNRSGSALGKLIRSKTAAEKLILIYDDIDLPFGTIKMSFDRGSGGHNGVESVIRSLKTRAFVRIRVGVAPTTPSGKIRKPVGADAVVDFLLGRLGKKEIAAFPDLEKRIVAIVSMCVSDGTERAMQVVNSGIL
jgi:peptidyl-tRNA hydrolase, PTH1 family